MSYVPAPTQAKTTEDLRLYLWQELQRLAGAFRQAQTVSLPILYVAPVKPVEGQLVIADGTDWNPGSGAGVYYFLAGSWNYLG